jgi:hypothetical protein
MGISLSVDIQRAAIVNQQAGDRQLRADIEAISRAVGGLARSN